MGAAMAWPRSRRNKREKKVCAALDGRGPCGRCMHGQQAGPAQAWRSRRSSAAVLANPRAAAIRAIDSVGDRDHKCFNPLHSWHTFKIQNVFVESLARHIP